MSRVQRDRVQGCIDAARAEGARLIVGGGRPALDETLANGFFLQPTLLEDGKGSTSASREEIFGPVTVLETWTNEADAAARANGTHCGLAAGVWTADLARAHRIARELEAGIVWVN